MAILTCIGGFGRYYHNRLTQLLFVKHACLLSNNNILSLLINQPKYFDVILTKSISVWRCSFSLVKIIATTFYFFIKALSQTFLTNIFCESSYSPSLKVLYLFVHLVFSISHSNNNTDKIHPELIIRTCLVQIFWRSDTHYFLVII